MDACYEYWNCTRSDCVMYEREIAMGCWEVEELLCEHQNTELLKTEQKYKCEQCNYYKSVGSDNPLTDKNLHPE